jgi:putative transposase
MELIPIRSAITEFSLGDAYILVVPSRLKRYQQKHDLHFITFSCYRRLPLLNTEHAKDTFEITLERTRRWYDFYLCGYVVMPEHVHLLISEPRRSDLDSVVQMLKQLVSRKVIRPDNLNAFWQTRYYDFNVSTDRKRIEKLRYMHRNPVKED